MSGWEPATDGDFFLFSSRLSDIEVKISFDLEVCFHVVLVDKPVLHARSLSIHLTNFSGSPGVETCDKKWSSWVD